MPELRFSTLRAHDLLEIERQPSQQLTLGRPGETTAEEAAILEAQPVAWTARDSRGRIRACFGIAEAFPGLQGQAWAVLAPGLGYAHLELTRFIQGQVAGAGLVRIELLARGPDMGWTPAHMTSGEVMQLAVTEMTKEMRWAVLLGFEPAHVLRWYGAAAETYVLFERLDKSPLALRRAA